MSSITLLGVSGIMDHFAKAREQFPHWDAAFPADWSRPTSHELARIASDFSCHWPPSFAAFQTSECHTTPIGDTDFDGFGWASPELDAYLSLSSVVEGSRTTNVPHFLSPFREDNGNYYCFDSRHPDSNGEFAVVLWDHNAGAIAPDPSLCWSSFGDWLLTGLTERSV